MNAKHAELSQQFAAAKIAYDPQSYSIKFEGKRAHHRGTTYFRNGRSVLSRGDLGGPLPPKGYGNYAAVIHSHSGHYFFNSNILHFSYQKVNGVDSLKEVTPPKDEMARFPNRWYCKMADYYSSTMGTSFDQDDPPQLKTFSTFSIDEATGFVTRTALPAGNESQLVWYIYKNGELWKKISERPVHRQRLTLKNGARSGHDFFVVLVVAETPRNERLLVSSVGRFIFFENKWRTAPTLGHSSSTFYKFTREWGY